MPLLFLQLCGLRLSLPWQATYQRRLDPLKISRKGSISWIPHNAGQLASHGSLLISVFREALGMPMCFHGLVWAGTFRLFLSCGPCAVQPRLSVAKSALRGSIQEVRCNICPRRLSLQECVPHDHGTNSGRPFRFHAQPGSHI